MFYWWHRDRYSEMLGMEGAVGGDASGMLESIGVNYSSLSMHAWGRQILGMYMFYLSMASRMRNLQRLAR